MLARIGRIAAGGALGLLLAAPLLVLFLGYLPLSVNTHSTSQGLAHAPMATLLNWIVPLVNGYPATLRVVSGFTPDRSWLGAAGVLLLVVAVAAPGAMRRHDGWLFLGLGGVLLLKAHGFPGLQWLGEFPVANRTNFETFAPPISSFCFAAVVAIAIDALSNGEVRLRWLGAGMAVLLGAVAVLLVANRPVLAIAPAASPWRQYLLYVLALIAAGAVVVAALGSVRIPRLRKFAGLLAAEVMLLELLLLFAPGAYAPRANPYEKPPWLSLVTHGLASHQEARVFGFDRELYPDTSGVFGIEDVRTLNALYVKRYVTFIRDFVSRSFGDRFTGDGMKPSEVENNPMFNLLGVRYILAGTTTVSTSAGPGAAAQYRALGTAGGVTVYQNEEATPRAFVVHDVKRVHSTAAAVSYLKSLGHRLPDGTTRVDAFHPGHQAVIEVPTRTNLPPLGPHGPGVPTRRTAISSYRADRVVVTAAAGAPGLLVLTDSYLPGWQATVNGRPAAVLPTDVAFRGVIVGSKASTVIFEYHPPHESLGWGLLGIGLMSVSLAGYVTNQRRRRAESSSGHLRGGLGGHGSWGRPPEPLNTAHSLA